MNLYGETGLINKRKDVIKKKRIKEIEIIKKHLFTINSLEADNLHECIQKDAAEDIVFLVMTLLYWKKKIMVTRYSLLLMMYAMIIQLPFIWII